MYLRNAWQTITPLSQGQLFLNFKNPDNHSTGSASYPLIVRLAMKIVLSYMVQSTQSNIWKRAHIGLLMVLSRFAQFLQVHPLDNGRSFPCIYGLLPNKIEETYNRLWQEVGSVVQDNQDDIMTDFEISFY